MLSQTIQLWFRALTKPSIETYEQLYHSNDANIRIALIWLIGTSVLSTGLSLIGKTLLPHHPLNQVNTPTATGTLSVEQATQISERMQWLANPWFWLFSGPIAFLLMIFVTHIFAQAVGGQGEMGRYSYVVAAIQSPINLLAVLLTWVPVGGEFVSTLISLSSYIFIIVATKAAYKLSVGNAIIAVLLQFGIFIFLLGCIVMFNVVPVLIGFAGRDAATI